MSYKSTIISDTPIAFYQLDDSGSVAVDYSECNNAGEYNGLRTTGILPLVAGSTKATKVTNLVSVDFNISNDYSGSLKYPTFATNDSQLNAFTLEAWIYPSFSTANITPIIADSANEVGLFWENNNLVFKAGEERLDYTLEYLNSSMYVVAVYSGSYMGIYVDGYIKAIKYVSNPFTNEALSLSCGPTTDSSDYILINNVAIYRYELSESTIKKHYNASIGIDPLQVVVPDKGDLFHLYDNGISTKFVYSYPGNKSWSNFIQTGLDYNQIDKYLQISKGTGSQVSIELLDYISIPSGITIDDSIIEWEGSNGITVQTSTDGITYVDCLNNHSIPQYHIDNGVDESRGLYIKIIISTTDDSKYLPKLKFLSIALYQNQKMYSYTSSDYFLKITDNSNVLSEANIGNDSYDILSRDDRNGVRTVSGSGFYINTSKDIKSIEFFYTPYSLGASGLIASTEGTETSFVWSSGGSISKSNIQSIYINGIDRSSISTVASLFKSKEIHHVVIILTTPITGNIGFNYSNAGSVKALYQNIGIYKTDISSVAQNHYELYTGTSLTSVSDMSMSLTESSVESYNIDWNVVQSN